MYDDSMLQKAMMMKVNGKRKRGRPKLTWWKQVEERAKKVGLKIEEARDRTRWREGVRAIADGDEVYPATFGNEEKTD